MTTTVNVSGVIGLPDGSDITLGAPQIVNPSPVGEVFEILLNATPQLVNVPASAVFVSIQPPANNTIGISVGTASTGNALRIHDSIGAPCLGLDPSVTQLYLSATSAMTQPTVIKFG